MIVHPPNEVACSDVRDLYVELLKRAVTRMIGKDQYAIFNHPPGTVKDAIWRFVCRKLRGRRLALVRIVPPEDRLNGRSWPADAETMVGVKRLSSLQECVLDILNNQVPGDIMETGVWRGGTCIFIAGMLRAYGDQRRTVWLADSFQGLPKPSVGRYPEDNGDVLWRYPELAVTEAEVQANFDRYGLWGPNVKLLKGWFSDTMSRLPMENLALLRLDGDMFESTMQVLEGGYSRVSPGGYIVIDDYGASPSCRAAVDRFRSNHRVEARLRNVDWSCVVWQKTEAAACMVESLGPSGRAVTADPGPGTTAQ